MSTDNTKTQADATYETEAETEASRQAEANAEAAQDGAKVQEPEASQEQNGAQDPVAAQMEELRKLAEENYQRFLRAQADFDNFRRRARQEKEDFAKYASLKLIEQLLPVVDNFGRAIAASKENRDFDALLKGLDMTYRQLDQVLSQEGLAPIEAVGQPFNPELHQAVMQVESEEHEEGIVVEELQKGYMLKDKVIRPAMVKVSV
ncbi:molecular chaperone GrpE [Gordoniibacillus kamchatkensis]|uniref:Protein GrpE n=1 Tax=Gordoniibacillus kamchatkensis TaxID=1590651 RepID=A0ABR5AB42_9BACL|nr:nucleotide exchange factor GrpE [Paenibacillus sp. VKM B-2647]KIL38280.1 molecular chaperone GrpE [Paenibacillus sp. VKM B-2647]